MTQGALLGGAAGLLLGIADFVILGYVIAAMRKERPGERLGAIASLNVVRFAQLLFFPLAGWFAGPSLASNLGG